MGSTLHAHAVRLETGGGVILNDGGDCLPVHTDDLCYGSYLGHRVDLEIRIIRLQLLDVDRTVIAVLLEVHPVWGEQICSPVAIFTQESQVQASSNPSVAE